MDKKHTSKSSGYITDKAIKGKSLEIKKRLDSLIEISKVKYNSKGNIKKLSQRDYEEYLKLKEEFKINWCNLVKINNSVLSEEAINYLIKGKSYECLEICEKYLCNCDKPLSFYQTLMNSESMKQSEFKLPFDRLRSVLRFFVLSISKVIYLPFVKVVFDDLLSVTKELSSEQQFNNSFVKNFLENSNLNFSHITFNQIPANSEKKVYFQKSLIEIIKQLKIDEFDNSKKTKLNDLIKWVAIEEQLVDIVNNLVKKNNIQIVEKNNIQIVEKSNEKISEKSVGNKNNIKKNIGKPVSSKIESEKNMKLNNSGKDVKTTDSKALANVKLLCKTEANTMVNGIDKVVEYNTSVINNDNKEVIQSCNSAEQHADECNLEEQRMTKNDMKEEKTTLQGEQKQEINADASVKNNVSAAIPPIKEQEDSIKKESVNDNGKVNIKKKDDFSKLSKDITDILTKLYEMHEGEKTKCNQLKKDSEKLKKQIDDLTEKNKIIEDNLNKRIQNIALLEHDLDIVRKNKETLEIQNNEMINGIKNLEDKNQVLLLEKQKQLELISSKDSEIMDLNKSIEEKQHIIEIKDNEIVNRINDKLGKISEAISVDYQAFLDVENTPLDISDNVKIQKRYNYIKCLLSNLLEKLNELGIKLEK